MDNIYLLLSAAFLFILLVGYLMEKIKVPWIFSALIFGAILSVYNPAREVTDSVTFSFIAQLGMYFLLFIIGFEIDIKEFRRASGFFVKGMLFIILFESIIGTIFIHYVFNYSWIVSFIVATSFSTVGEAILIPILDEFKLVNTKLGQAIIGIGTLDDIVEILILILAILTVGANNDIHVHSSVILISIFILFILAFFLMRFKDKNQTFIYLKIEVLFLFFIFILFLFVGIGEYSNATAIAALLAGISLKAFIPEGKSVQLKSTIKTICYGFFAPIFFIWVGVSLNLHYLLGFPLLVLLVVLISAGAKIVASIIFARKDMGIKNSIMLGVGLSVRFSTSIIISKLMLENNLIGHDLYSIIIASSIIFTLIIPFIFSVIVNKWNTQKIDFNNSEIKSNSDRNE